MQGDTIGNVYFNQKVFKKMKFYDLTKTQDHIDKWQSKRAQWLMKNNSSFLDHFDNELYKKIIEAKKTTIKN
jgi:hypothetical protein